MLKPRDSQGKEGKLCKRKGGVGGEKGTTYETRDYERAFTFSSVGDARQ